MNNFNSPDDSGFANINGTGKWYYLDQSVSNNEQIELNPYMDNYLCTYFNSLGILTRYVAWFNLEKMGATGYNVSGYSFDNPQKRPILYFRIDYATGEITVMQPQFYKLTKPFQPDLNKKLTMTASVDADGNIKIVLIEENQQP